MRSYLAEVDFAKIKQRFAAFWERKILDRPLISITTPRKERREANYSIPESIKRRWTDIEYILQKIEWKFDNTLFLGDALPFYVPNIGPDSFTAYLGGNLKFKDEQTSWIEPFVDDLSEYEPVFDKSNQWWQFMNELIDAVCQVAENNFLVGIPDLHGGGDCLAAIRHPDRLALDLYDQPEEVKRIMRKLTQIYLEIFDSYYEKISTVQEGSITWIPAYSLGKYTALQNDFSGLISPSMFKFFFLPGDIVKFSQYLDNSLFHLDGPTALGNLDYLLEVDTLDGIQWVPGAGTKPMSEWIGVCAKVLNVGKCLQIHCRPDEVEFLLSKLKPEGLFLCTSCSSEEEGRSLLKKVEEAGGKNAI